jgi:hypothetical protein
MSRRAGVGDAERIEAASATEGRVSERDDRSRRIIIGPAGETVGRQVRTLLDDGWRVIGFVGDFDADREVLDEFVRDVNRPES